MRYSLAFGFEVVILVEIGAPLFRVKHFDELKNKELMRSSFDLLDEKKRTSTDQNGSLPTTGGKIL